ncbi:DUF4129 domain-containing protein [Actinocrispum wychmicini]|uniref:Uncharacterized protein DUF4129 n=1 Tax=Actinocrispum wychmicini TaxID=1213861 RepID=A0A4R2JYE4_9PSEU|nr:DUF4129 domain-containing protein [Actinocrispum wychmicini]TCO62458.1 uncharacterized protein DUF4129 [Actinocrispum wychmicini]
MSDTPVDVGRDAARDAATRELSDPAYHQAAPSWIDRALRWLVARLMELLNAVNQFVPGGFLGLIIIIAVIVVIRTRAGRMTRTASGAVFAGKRLSASDHRRAAEEAVARGDLAEAVRERFRAIARGLEERGVLDERSGRTVDELAREAGARIPPHATALRSAALMFDDVWYGGHPATLAGYHELVDLDLALDGVRA